MERLRAFTKAIVDNEHRDTLRCFAGGESQRADGCKVVRAVDGRPVRSRVAHTGGTGGIAGARNCKGDFGCGIERLADAGRARVELHSICHWWRRSGSGSGRSGSDESESRYVKEMGGTYQRARAGRLIYSIEISDVTASGGASGV